MGEEQPQISVVVPTRDRPEALRKCLAALERQTVPVEIVVIEDTEGRGPAWARNQGVRRAQGEVICFTDDDCEPEAGWAEALAAPIFSGEAEATSGPVSIGDGARAADKAWAAIVHHLQARAASPGTASPGFVVTANLAVRRSLLERMPFDESFTAAAGEDRDWGERMVRRGSVPRFVSEATVVHRSGMRVWPFLRQQYRYGSGAARYRGRDPGRHPGSPGFYLGLLGAGFRVGLRPGLLVCVAQAATIAGVARETAKKLPQGAFLRSRR